MTVSTGSNTRLNTISGVMKIMSITAAEKVSLASQVFPANIILKDENGVLYLTDGVTSIASLSALKLVPTSLSELTNDSGFITNTNNCVHQSGNESIGGIKSFLNTPYIHSPLTGATTACGYLKLVDLTFGTSPSSTNDYAFKFVDGNDAPYGEIGLRVQSNGHNTIRLRVLNTDGTTSYDKQILFDVRNTDGFTSFAPSASGSNMWLGTTSNRWTGVVADNYYLGTTAFGDIVTHNYSEFVSSSALNAYVAKYSDTSELGRCLDLHYDNETATYDYDVRIEVISQGTAAGTGVLNIAASQLHIPAPAANANDTRAATTAWVNGRGFLTSHPTISLTTNTTSTEAPAQGDTFTCIDSLTQDANGHVTQLNVKTVTLPTLATVATSGSYNDLSDKPTSMTPASHTHGNITNDGKIGTAANKPLITTTGGAVTTGSFGTTANTFCQGNDSRLSDARTPTAHNHAASDITSGTLDAARIPNLDASKITSGTIDIARLPAGALERLVTVANQAARFALTTTDVQLGDVVKQTDTGIMYYVVDTSHLSSADGYSEFTAGAATSVPWSGVTGKPSSYTPASHSHGNITNTGAIGTAANKPLITTTNGVVTTGSFGTTANTFCQGNDSRLSDARTPTAHTHDASDITSGLATVATSGSYNDLSDTPTIPTVNNAKLTIQQNGTTVKTFTANASSNVTANITVPTKTSDLTNDSHQTITVDTDTTSTASPAHSGTFTCVDSVTRDSNGHVTAINTKTVTLPADNNTDTLVTQNKSTSNNTYPVLACPTANANANQGAKTAIFAAGIKINPNTSAFYATTLYNNNVSLAPITTAQVTTMLSNKLDASATRDGANWLDTNYTMFVNEYNATNPAATS